MPESKKGLPEDFITRYSKNYIEDLAKEKILNKVKEIEIDKIEKDANQPRRNFDEQSLNELASSIREKGVLEPILLRQVNDNYIIIAGERRWRASKIAGKTSIPAIIIEPKNEKEIREIQIIENLQREDITPIERAKVIHEYLKPTSKGKNVKTLLINMRLGRHVPEEFALTVSALCNTIGKTPITLVRWLSLLDLPEDVQEKVDSPNSPITSRHIEQLLKLKDFELLREVLKTVEKENLSSEATKNLVSHLGKRDSGYNLSKVANELEKLVSRISFIDSEKELSVIKQELLIIRDLVEELLQKV